MSRSRRHSVFVVSSVLAALVVAGLSCRKSEAVVEDPTGGEAERYLLDYLRIDTSNPPGRETAAAKYLQGILAKDGLQAQLFGDDPDRQSLYLRLPSGNPAPALLLLHHLDVVPANAHEWSVAPFSGSRSGGYIWGRGSLDIKSLGIAELMAVLDLKRSGAKLKRDVILLAVADEEAGSEHGMRSLFDKHPDLFRNVGFVLNEGGANETIVDRVSYWGIEIDEKIPLWLRLTSKGRAAHSAVPPEDGGAALALIEAINRLVAIPRPYRVTPSVKQYFQSVARVKKGVKQKVYAQPEAYLNSPEMMGVLGSGARSLLQDTLAVTTLSSSGSANVVPSSASATLDIRLLPDRSPDDVLQQMRAAVAGKAEIRVVLQGLPAAPSPMNTELYSVLSTEMKRTEPDSVVGPVVSPGTSDSRFFRSRGVVAYGISPFKVNYYDANTVHGVDERIRSNFFREGVHLTRRIVRGFCAN
ncbi:MAG: M20/M25/M40 family metallo-hydrolase [Acidobacteriota bacterium]